MASDETASTIKVVSAEELRMKILEREMELMRQRDAARDAERNKLSAFAETFMTEHVTEKERAMVTRLVMNAVNEGKTEALVYSFPSSLTTDGGRSINNGEPDWPTTLQGKARELYERYVAVARPQGYKLKAMIINFPGGMPGDVGLFLDWAGDAR
jgi:hypothetical protein